MKVSLMLKVFFYNYVKLKMSEQHQHFQTYSRTYVCKQEIIQNVLLNFRHVSQYKD